MGGERVDITGADLVENTVIYLDGRERQVLEVSDSDVPGYRHLRLEGFTLPLHIGAHWQYTHVRGPLAQARD